MQANINALLGKQQPNNSITNTSNSNNNGVEVSSGNLSWNQSSEEVEVHLKIPADVTAKLIKVNIASTNLKVVLPAPNTPSTKEVCSSEDEINLYSSTGANLYGKVNVSDSTWCIEGTGLNKVLTITLAKPSNITWPTLLK